MSDAVEFANADITTSTTYYQAFSNCVYVGVNGHFDFAGRLSLRATALVGLDLWSARNVSGLSYTAMDFSVSGSVDFIVRLTDCASVGLFAGLGNSPSSLDNGDGSSLKRHFGVEMAFRL